MSTPNRRHLSIALALGLAIFACVSLAHVSGLTLGLAYLSPAVFVFVLLWLGHYPGEKLLAALSRPRRLRRKASAPRLALLAVAHMPRGGALLANALAGRAPPLIRRSHSKFSTA
jgi:hypothetical protein